ncbi:uncharacterized protein BKCO1_5900010 [Diplodia corticola]|uniref:Uncharacterized protein n=1 Tax=Diplodia corticola TaxID=236234 RepID=A0A1J9QQ26_9PEZI|nr:uncharacterized protein BKCO1_5900010 [Diplodia corticola]OJD30568.1 hypothetical protein BKCO1_5900010 [Diplodia corticola]
MPDSLATLLARLSGGLLPQSISDQASKMFVKRLLKHLFDRLEQLFVQLAWAALTGLFQAFWLLVLQKVAGGASAGSVVASASSSSSSSASLSGRGEGAGGVLDGGGGVVEAAGAGAGAGASAAGSGPRALPPSPPHALTPTPAALSPDSESSGCAAPAAVCPITPITPRSGGVRLPPNVYLKRSVPSGAALPVHGVRDGEKERSARMSRSTMSPKRQSGMSHFGFRWRKSGN